MLQRTQFNDGQNLDRGLPDGRKLAAGYPSLPSIRRFLILTLVLTLAGCTSPEPLTFRYQLPATPVTLDPAKSNDTYSNGIIDRLFDGLMRFDRENNLPVPELAEWYQVSDDGLVYEFRVNPDARFHNNRQVFASDFKYSWERLLDPEINSPQAWLFDLLVGADDYRAGRAKSVVGIEVEDPHVIRLRLRQPFGPFLFHLARPAASVVPHEEVERLEQTFEHLPVGSGPYRFVSWQDNERVELAAFDGHPLHQPQVRRLIYEIERDEFEALRRYEAGELDLVSRLPPGRLRLFQEGHSTDLRIFPGMNWSGFCFRCDQPPFNDSRVRRAFALAVNRDVLVPQLGDPHYNAAVGFLPQSILGHDPAHLISGYDLDKAARLLAEAGYSEGKGFPALTNMSPTGEIEALMADFLMDAFHRLGITVEFQATSFDSLIKLRREGNAPLSIRGWSGEYPDPEAFLRPLFHSRGSDNDSAYENSEVDRLLDTARIEYDADNRRALYQQAEKLIIKDAPCVVLFHRTAAILLRPRWRNIPIGYLQAYLEIERAELAEER
ncbi:MAG: ABC transporter substrate-binding protein [bacterium]|nr:ABC transporter substrate-binding protein [bacterium]